MRGWTKKRQAEAPTLPRTKTAAIRSPGFVTFPALTLGVIAPRVGEWEFIVVRNGRNAPFCQKTLSIAVPGALKNGFPPAKPELATAMTI
jgi:hypothetical protein